MPFLVALIVFFKPPVRNVSVCVSVCGPKGVVARICTSFAGRARGLKLF